MMTADKLAPLLYKVWNPGGASWDSLTASTRSGWRVVAAEAIKLLRKEAHEVFPEAAKLAPPPQGAVGCAMRGKDCIFNEVTPCPKCGNIMVHIERSNMLRCPNCKTVQS